MAALPQTTVALFAKYPLPGAAKTRLIPALGPAGAAHVHRLLVERTVAVVRESGLPLTLWHTGAPARDFARWLGGDIALMEQGDGDLGARLARVPAPAILLGADIPGLAARHLRQAARALATCDAVIGPALDGGYYLLGFNRPLPFLFADMAWGTAGVLEETLVRLRDAALDVTLLETLADCDLPADLAPYPELLP